MKKTKSLLRKNTINMIDTRDYSMDLKSTNKLLIHEKIFKMIMYMQANISYLLLKNEDFDYWNALSKILNEPPEIIQVIIEPNIEEFEGLDKNKKSIIKYVKEYIKKNTIEEKNKIYIIKKRYYVDSLISTEDEDYFMIMKINDNSMHNKERLLIIDFKIPKRLLKEWREAFSNIPKIIESVIQSLETNRENKNLILQLKNLSETDKLTNIYNRRMLDKLLLKQKNSYGRYNEKYSIIIADIDHFKKVNDTYGHNVGDKVLCEIAKLFKSNIRKTDIVGRWGGEEFLIICEHTDLFNAKILAESLRKRIEDYFFTEVGSLTVSFGVSEFLDGNTIEQVIEKADKALYKAKRGGRNRIGIYYNVCA